MTEPDTDLVALFRAVEPPPPDDAFVGRVRGGLRRRRLALALGAGLCFVLTALALALLWAIAAGGDGGWRVRPETALYLIAGVCAAALFAFSPRIFRELRS